MQGIAVTLPKEYEEQLLQNFMLINQQAVDLIFERIKDDRKMIRQTELLKRYRIGNELLMDMLAKGLPQYRLSSKNILYNVDEVDEFIRQHYKL
ncbi:hypothetical protein I4Q36_02050 [Tuanshanicoccus lijuaniae]|uniref:hypothetical protein n=1 Tax=Aerococcaceae bacterium zg-1292 TaxID=2774330 RepID=UPI00193807DA|nr:hypothetical protein [Aerococcaceae bacterium zg-1292]MBS4456993.1 hypothetical protein [Aerococcaceae bacterium zg-A91]MBS4458742.1 hypothetical protein [Aerococcaceae bacterium zg-BR33]QQA37522.1 hypothetical protein I4Q36_02050 [Aerococcaceae bacterium zg-1292]